MTAEQTSHGDARGYSWPPFEPGNEAAVTHGAHSPRKVRPVADQLKRELVAAAPWAMGPTFAAVVEAWAVAEAQCRLLREWLDEVGILDDAGEPRGALKALSQAESRADRARTQLGLSPAAWASLHRAMTTGPDGTSGALEALVAQGRAMLTAGAGSVDESGDEPEEGDDGGSFEAF